MTIKLIHQIQFQRMVTHLWFKTSYISQCTQDWSSTKSLINCCLYLFTLHLIESHIAIFQLMFSKLRSIGLKCHNVDIVVKISLLQIWMICNINIHSIQSCTEKHNHVLCSNHKRIREDLKFIDQLMCHNVGSSSLSLSFNIIH